jgi:putative membrane protein
VSYVSYRYRLGDGELVIQQGIVTRNERHVPYARIQNIDVVQSLLQRWLGVGEARFETASGDEPEAVMRVLSLAEVASVRERVFGEPRGAPSVAGEAPAEAARAVDEPLYRARLAQLVCLGLTSNRGLAVVAAAFGALWQLDWPGFDPERILRELGRIDVSHAPVPSGPLAGALFALAGLAVVIAGLKTLSVVWTVFRLHGFELRGRGDDLSARYGLWTRVAATVPRQRIQLLSIRRGPIHRLLGAASVQIETAGRGGGEGSEVERLWLAPWIDDRGVPALASRALAGADLASATWLPVAPRAGPRILRRGLVLALAVGASPAVLFGPAALVTIVPLAALVVLHARLWPRHARYALLPDAIVWRSGWWTRRTSIVRYEKIQVVTRVESPFDRRHHMASVHVDTAGAGHVGHAFVLRYLTDRVADELAGRLESEAGARAFRW